MPTNPSSGTTPLVPNVNQVVLVGQLTQDPVTRQIPDDRTVCELRIAVNDRRDQPPLFVDISVFGKEADTCAQYLVKGRQVAVTGRLTYQQWETRDGSKRSKHQVNGRVTFGSGDRPAGTSWEGGDGG